jgi:hypothetical protein
LGIIGLIDNTKTTRLDEVLKHVNEDKDQRTELFRIPTLKRYMDTCHGTCIVLGSRNRGDDISRALASWGISEPIRDRHIY